MTTDPMTSSIAIIGLGYVGLPLAVEFGKKFTTIGFDIHEARLSELRKGFDRTRELSAEGLAASPRLRYTNQVEDLKEVDGFIVTVPTPIDAYHQPDLTPLRKASETVGRALKPGAIVIYESTVYPGCTEEICVPILEQVSGLTFNQDFYCGYSPERINPGDKVHTVTKILKVTSGSTPEVADTVDALYRSIITAGTYKASSIKVAEAAKVIENSQRDINIAFVNELSLIFEKLGIDTLEVLEAAGTKWNFLPFRPGLVGGHCIGVDPYYLTHKAEAIGYHPQIILAGRRLNDNMGQQVANRVIKLLIKRGHRIQGARVGVLGITFKENCPDIRNSRAIDVIRELQDFGCEVQVSDPWATPEDVHHEYGLELSPMSSLETESFDAIILAVAHDEFKQIDFQRFREQDVILFDIKSILPKELVDGRL
ncbi:MAG: Vi polysaccharide biosynthesis UDP-N-acetylglucosamine C-6 dehydrogenase TviB [Kiritimatiellae bacterium]|jgi:UDP-N-acetyl-D-galactosamine dehydrogenase|nr:Vi polysaccharide biosynthesis UDP-N-acetylglucosamine C-6 dehydrogenase TviB [Kiritimatiellia bacterium]